MFNRSRNSSVIRNNYSPSEVLPLRFSSYISLTIYVLSLFLFNYAIIIVTHFFSFATHHVIVYVHGNQLQIVLQIHITYILYVCIIFDPHSAASERRYSSCYTRARDFRDYRAKYLADTRTHYLCIQVQRCSC